jgi:hypothetical protein
LIFLVPANVQPEVAIGDQFASACFGSRFTALDVAADTNKAPSIEEERTATGMRFIATDDLKFYYRALWLR